MIPAGTALAQTPAKPMPYMACIYIPHGAVAANWDPKETGRNYTMSPILKPLEPYRQYLTIVSGLRNRAAESPAPHAITPGTWLTAVHPPHSQQPDVGPSVEQVAARILSQGLPLQSIELAGEGGGGASDPAFGASYSDTISFRTGRAAAADDSGSANGVHDTVRRRQHAAAACGHPPADRQHP